LIGGGDEKIERGADLLICVKKGQLAGEISGKSKRTTAKKKKKEGRNHDFPRKAG